MTLLSLLIRHALAMCSGWFASHGIDGSNTVGLVTGVLVLFIATVWSIGEKWMGLKPGQLNDAAMVRSIAAAIASQVVTALSVILATDVNSPEVLIITVLNVIASRFGLHQKLTGAPVVKVLALSSCLLTLPSCSTFTQQDAKEAGVQIGLAAADAAVFIARMQLASAESELNQAASMPGADPREIAVKRLGVIAAQKALDEAEKAIAKQRAKSAKNPVNVQPGISFRFQVSGFKLA